MVWFGAVLKLEPTEFANGIGLRCEQNRRVRNDTKYLVRATGRMGFALLRWEVIGEEQGWRLEEHQEDSF